MSRKITIALIFFLFLTPFVSWYYLKSGLDWRKKAEAVMSGKQKFPELPFQNSISGKPLERSQLEYHVSLLVLVSCDSAASQQDLAGTLYHQFKETHKANFLFVDTCSLSPFVLSDTLRENVYSLHCVDTLSSCNALLQDWPAGKNFALIDKTGTIRSYYTASNHDEKKMLLEHMALLLPRDYSEKVELKRQGDKK
jgi:hypothetical protein